VLAVVVTSKATSEVQIKRAFVHGIYVKESAATPALILRQIQGCSHQLIHFASPPSLKRLSVSREPLLRKPQTVACLPVCYENPFHLQPRPKQEQDSRQAVLKQIQD
jgi:hypothetical protein